MSHPAQSRLLPAILALSAIFSQPAWAEDADARPIKEKYEEWMKEERLEHERQRQAAAKEAREAKEAQQAAREAREASEAKEAREAREIKEARDARQAKEARTLRHRRRIEAAAEHHAIIRPPKKTVAIVPKKHIDKPIPENDKPAIHAKAAQRHADVERGLEAQEIAEEQFAADPASALSTFEQAAAFDNPLAKAMLALWGAAMAMINEPGAADNEIQQKADAWLEALSDDDIEQLQRLADKKQDILAQLLLGQLYALELIAFDQPQDTAKISAHLFELASDNDDPIPAHFLAQLCRLNANDPRTGVQKLANFCQTKQASAATPAPPRPAPENSRASQIVDISNDPAPIIMTATALPVPVIEPDIIEIPPDPSYPQTGRFGLAKYELSFAEWDACVEEGACPPIQDSRFGRHKHPAINVSWQDAQTYIRWLNQATGKHYRLPTGAEWYYAARAGAASFPQNRCGQAAQANYDDRVNPCNNFFREPLAYQAKTTPVGHYRPNAFGLYDMAGNVREWMADCDDDASPQTMRCTVRGGSWADGNPYNGPVVPQPANRPNPQTGFRLALDMP